MATRSRIRRLNLVTGTLLSLLIAAAFVVSAWWLLALQIPTPYGPAVTVSGGCFGLTFDDRRPNVFVAESRIVAPWAAAGSGPNWQWWNYWEVGWRRIGVPLYALFAAVAIPTLLVWRFWPKPVKPGHCRCGYDLTGNTSGVCPECGVEVQA